MNEETIFLGALERVAAERDAYLTGACGDDLALRRRVEHLLRLHERAGRFLAQPPADLAPTTAPTTLAEGAAAPAAGDGPGTVIGRYTLVRRLGEGGMGTVFLAEQGEPVRRTVALKLIKRGMDSAQVLARFEAERQALALMDHPNIAKVLDGGATDDGRPFFVMELVEGVPITRFCDGQRQTVRQRLELFVPVCRAVQHAHQKGVIHRDLKPSNVLVALYDGRPVPKVIDFGLAKALQEPLTDRTLVTGLGAVLGTPEYMSPEQAGLNPHDVDTRSDVYALGALLYELLTGAMPLGRERVQGLPLLEVLRRVREEQPPPPSRRLGASPTASEVQGELDWITMKALEKDRDRRYESAGALADDVGRHLADEPVSAGPPSRRYRLGKFARKHRAALATAAAFVALLLAGTAISTWQAVRATAAERERDGQRVTAEEEADISRAVLDFLNENVLGQAGATNQAGAGHEPDPDLKVRTALDRAAAGVAGKFAGRPRVEVAVRTALGSAYCDVAAYDAARAQLDEAVRLARDALGEDHPDTLRATNELALVYLKQGDHDAAEALFARARDGYGRRHGEDHEGALRARTNLATVAQARGDLDRAEALYADVLEAQRRALGEEHRLTLETTANLALLYQVRGRFREGERLLTAVLEAQRKTLRDEHPNVLTTRRNLAALYQAEGQNEQALPILLESLEATRRALGDEHDDTCASRNNLATCYTETGKLDLAEPLYERNLEVQRRLLGEEHRHTVGTLRNLAALYFLRGEYARAEPLFARALAVLHRTAAADSPDVIHAANGLAVSCHRQHKYAEAEPPYKEALAACRKVLGEEHPRTLMITQSLAAVYRDWGKDDQAEPLFEQVRAALARRPGGADDPQTAKVLVSLGLIRLRRQKAAEAEPLLREALRIYEKQSPEAWYRFDAQGLLGESLAAQARHADAEPLVLAGYEGMRQRAKEISPGTNYLAEAGERVVRLYEAWGKPEEAAAWRAKLAKPPAPPSR